MWIQFTRTGNPGWDEYNGMTKTSVFDTVSHLENGYSNNV